jgi:hypothetical protein
MASLGEGTRQADAAFPGKQAHDAAENERPIQQKEVGPGQDVREVGQLRPVAKLTLQLNRRSSSASSSTSAAR